MALKKKKKAPAKPSTGENYFTISKEEKKKILGILLILLSILILFSILSYSRFDKANLHYELSYMYRVFTADSEFQHKTDSTRNCLCIFGSYISDFFINSTLGIFSAVFPIMFFIWGFSFFQKINLRFIIHTSNLLLISGILLASFFGVVRSHYNLFANVYE